MRILVSYPAVAVLCATLGCSSDPAAPACSTACEPLLAAATTPTTEADLAPMLEEIRQALFPELAGLTIELHPLVSDSDFFQANLDLATLDGPPEDRVYYVRYNVTLFDDPPPGPAVVAVLAHELAHIVDYTAMDSEELAEFALDYLAGALPDYERATDEHALELGCGAGLKQYREWSFSHLDPALVEEKRRVYYTPEEIAEWVSTCVAP